MSAPAPTRRIQLTPLAGRGEYVMCKSCRTRTSRLREEPATECELFLMRKHRQAGTAPAMPKWYQAHWRACVERGYVAICDARSSLFDVLAICKREMHAPQVYNIPDERTTKRYVREFCKLNNLRIKGY